SNAAANVYACPHASNYAGSSRSLGSVLYPYDECLCDPCSSGRLIIPDDVAYDRYRNSEPVELATRGGLGFHLVDSHGDDICARGAFHSSAILKKVFVSEVRVVILQHLSMLIVQCWQRGQKSNVVSNFFVRVGMKTPDQKSKRLGTVLLDCS